jgi:hypothetical protein
MVQYGNAFTVMDLYRLPTYLRLFYYKKLVDSKKKETEQIKSTNKSSKVRFKR